MATDSPGDDSEEPKEKVKDEATLEVERLRQENAQLREISSNQLRELQKVAELGSENTLLKEELMETQQILTEMRIKNQRLEREVEEANETMLDEDIVERLKKKVSELEEENRQLLERQNQQRDDVDFLHQELETHRMRYEKAETEKVFFVAEMNALKEELDSIKRQGFSFREFVALKKELAAVKDERDAFKAQLSLATSKFGPMAVMSLKPVGGAETVGGRADILGRGFGGGRSNGGLGPPRSAPPSRMKERQQQQQQLQQQMRPVVVDQKPPLSKAESRKRRDGRDSISTPTSSSTGSGPVSRHSTPFNGTSGLAGVSGAPPSTPHHSNHYYPQHIPHNGHFNNHHHHYHPNHHPHHHHPALKHKSSSTSSSSSSGAGQPRPTADDLTVFGSVIGHNY